MPPALAVQGASGNVCACATCPTPNKATPAAKAAAATQTAAFPPDCLPEDLVHSLTAMRFPVRLQKITLYILFIYHSCNHATFIQTPALPPPSTKQKQIHTASILRLKNRLRPFKPTFLQQKSVFPKRKRRSGKMRSIRSRNRKGKLPCTRFPARKYFTYGQNQNNRSQPSINIEKRRAILTPPISHIELEVPAQTR